MELWKPLNILSYGAGMPSTALVGMACENARRGYPVWPHVPVYDAVIFCDLHSEPAWDEPDRQRPVLDAGRGREERENAAPVYL